MYSYFCSNGCYNDFANAIYSTSHCDCTENREPLETPIENPEKTKHENDYGYTYYETNIRER
jgi:hypothetical protein